MNPFRADLRARLRAAAVLDELPTAEDGEVRAGFEGFGV